MISPDDLLDVARQLARGSTEASWRRAVSTAYYALFHLLVDAAATRMFPERDREALRGYLGRAFAHGSMRKVAVQFKSGSVEKRLGPSLGGQPIREELREVATAFVDLQTLRHEADYDKSRNFDRAAAADKIEDAEQAFRNWKAVRGTVQADAFLVGMLADRNMRG